MPKTTPLRITTTGAVGATARLELDGVDISAQVTGVTVDLEAAEVNRAFIRYACVQVETEGDFQIVHKCGIDNQPRGEK